MPITSPDLWYKRTNVQVIAIIDTIIATLYFIMTAWHLFREILFIKKKSRKIDLDELGELFARFVVLIIATIQWLVAKRLITQTNKISEKPKRALKGCFLWRKYSLFLLFFWIANLIYLVYSYTSDHKFSLIFLICEILFRIFALYYVGSLATDLVKLLEPSMKNTDTLHIFPDGESQNTTIIQISDYSEAPSIES